MTDQRNNVLLPMPMPTHKALRAAVAQSPSSKGEPAALTDRAMHRHGYTKPMSKQGAWCSPLAADHANATSMALGSKALLAALWRSHPIILARHAAAGRQVVRP